MGREHIGRVRATCPNPLPIVLSEDLWPNFCIPYDLKLFALGVVCNRTCARSSSHRLWAPSK
jgi:hypothetical protein